MYAGFYVFNNVVRPLRFGAAVRRRRWAQDGYVQEVERRDGGVPCQRLRDVRGHGIWDIAGERGRGCADIPSLRGLR